MTKHKDKWSKQVTEHDNALGLEPGVFANGSPKEIAASLKRSADAKQDADPHNSAMSMLDFYINRAGKNLSPDRKRALEDSKHELRKLYGK